MYCVLFSAHVTSRARPKFITDERDPESPHAVPYSYEDFAQNMQEASQFFRISTLLGSIIKRFCVVDQSSSWNIFLKYFFPHRIFSQEPFCSTKNLLSEPWWQSLQILPGNFKTSQIFFPQHKKWNHCKRDSGPSIYYDTKQTEQKEQRVYRILASLHGERTGLRVAIS